MLLKIKDLAKTYVTGGGMFGKKSHVRAVNGVSFSIESGKTFALVGESGCGKSTIAKMILLLETPSAGSLFFDGVNLLDMSASELKNYRRQTQAVFQDPYASLNPRHKTRLLISEPVMAHERHTNRELAMRVEELLD
ncbi:MAG: ATP-binding cassette domain-containing protein, partial [Magnetovibrio sp.]|nr:ATP-binding cassette domain-containing protein [Magnetovibrio sp.]